MKNVNDFKSLGVSERMKLSEKLGAKVAIIVNKAMEKCNKILLPIGHGVNIKIEFYKLEPKLAEETEKEMTNG